MLTCVLTGLFQWSYLPFSCRFLDDIIFIGLAKETQMKTSLVPDWAANTECLCSFWTTRPWFYFNMSNDQSSSVSRTLQIKKQTNKQTKLLHCDVRRSLFFLSRWNYRRWSDLWPLILRRRSAPSPWPGSARKHATGFSVSARLQMTHHTDALSCGKASLSPLFLLPLYCY